ncbi:MAG: hypothetical protein A3G76_11640 [Acidobacteria bacterium RIFCSPLOWO2_12_FULL_65_11]|nr:MAG: hypothetical protein A3H95_11850 [Acidobacteria bacterium RIFCSPLOWO2_02_FULL_64_15]OFW32924.1 MAG: hypothetical protein A3G76_11640 [Acidobacteria bacterium RIFCSPLOWO2_12_FULL_65_11]
MHLARDAPAFFFLSVDKAVEQLEAYLLGTLPLADLYAKQFGRPCQLLANCKSRRWMRVGGVQRRHSAYAPRPRDIGAYLSWDEAVHFLHLRFP